MNSLPAWPAMMRRTMAAKYLDLTPAQFEAEINAGNLPTPIKLGNSEHWSRRKLDEALEQLHGGEVDWRVRAGLRAAG